MALSNQLGLSEDSLVKAPNGQGECVTATMLMNILYGSFIFVRRNLGDSTCVAVASKAG
jgi:hypothetical protein